MTHGLLKPQETAPILGWSTNYLLKRRREGVGPHGYRNWATTDQVSNE